MSYRIAKIVKNPLFLVVVIMVSLILISTLGPAPDTYYGRLRRCINMCRESSHFGRLLEPKRASPKNTIADYQCQCY